MPVELAAIAIERLRAVFVPARDPARAEAMAAYMRDRYPFLGLPAPEQRRLARVALAGLPAPSEADVVAVTAACWAEPEREYQYAACDYAIRHVRRCGPGFLDHARVLDHRQELVGHRRRARPAGSWAPLSWPIHRWAPRWMRGSTPTTSGWLVSP